jgi:H+/Cl- antiporter ClcA
VGYATLDQLLAGRIHLSPELLMQLLALKVTLAAFSLGAGLVGGVFAPALFFGAIIIIIMLMLMIMFIIMIMT